MGFQESMTVFLIVLKKTLMRHGGPLPRRSCRTEVLWKVEKIDKAYRSSYCKPMEVSMNTVTVSSKYQVVIPKEIREDVGLKVGTIMEIVTYGNRIELIPIQPISTLKGIFKGINTEMSRDEDRL